jgi:3D (Asp-Asp-Asp) domain-containing protein
MTTLRAFMAFSLLSGAVLSALPAYANAPTVQEVSNYPVTLTAYNAVPDQTSDHPLVTASGAYSNPEVVAARSQDLANLLPFGTVIAITGPSSSENSCGYGVVAPIIGYRVIADTMNARYTDRLDILFNTNANYLLGNGIVKNAAPILGRCDGASIRIVGHINISNPAELPKTQQQLAALVNGNGNSVALQ